MYLKDLKSLVILILVSTSLTWNNAYSQCAPKMVLFEQSCFKNCGPCIFHQVNEIDPLYKANIDKIAMVIYWQAPIGIGSFSNTNLPYAGFHKTFGIDYQSEIIADRTFFSDNYNLTQGPTSEGIEDAAKAFDTQSNSTYVPVTVGISNTYDPSTRKVDITLTANFCDTASGDLRFYLVLTQDTLIGPAGIDYAQNIAQLPGSKWNGYSVVEFPNEIGAWIESYPFKDVVKYQPSGFFGNAGIIPQKPIIGTTYTEKYSFTLPKKNSTTEKVEIDPNRIQIIAAVVKKGGFKKRQVLNANKKYLTVGTVNTSQLSNNDVNFTVNNPVSNELILHYSTTDQSFGSINIYNASGDIIKSFENIELGNFRSSKNIDVSDLSNGIYFVSLKAQGVFHTRKFIVAKL